MRAMIDKAIQRFSAVFALMFLLGASGIAWAQSALPALFDVAALKAADHTEEQVCRLCDGDISATGPVQQTCIAAVN